MYYSWTLNYVGVIFDIDDVVGETHLGLEDPAMVEQHGFHILRTPGAGNVIDLQLNLFDHIGFGYLCKSAVLPVIFGVRVKTQYLGSESKHNIWGQSQNTISSVLLL